MKYLLVFILDVLVFAAGAVYVIMLGVPYMAIVFVLLAAFAAYELYRVKRIFEKRDETESRDRKDPEPR